MHRQCELGEKRRRGRHPSTTCSSSAGGHTSSHVVFNDSFDLQWLSYCVRMHAIWPSFVCVSIDTHLTHNYKFILIIICSSLNITHIIHSLNLFLTPGNVSFLFANLSNSYKHNGQFANHNVITMIAQSQPFSFVLVSAHLVPQT